MLTFESAQSLGVASITEKLTVRLNALLESRLCLLTE